MNWNLVSTFSDVIIQAAQAYGDKVAFKDQFRELSFITYQEEVDKLASALFSNGVRPGDRVAILSQNRVEVAVILGLSKAGYVPVPLSWRLPAEGLAALLSDCRPSVLFVEDRYISMAAECSAHLDDCAVVCVGREVSGVDSYQDLLSESAEGFFHQVVPEDPACIIYTSGTTGAPKGAVLSHRGVAGNCRDVAVEAIKFHKDDRTLMVMPLFHVGGIWYYLFPSFVSGCMTFIRERFEPEDVINACSRESITNLHIVPTMLAELLSRPGFALAAESLRLIVYAGSSMPSDLLRQAMGTLSGCGFCQAYGSTEAGSITALSVEAHEQALEMPACSGLLRSCGKPIGDTQVFIDKAIPDSADPVGEILVRSSKMMSGYWNLPDATAERLQDGWLRTGDLGYFDADGYLYIVDRKNDMVISGGENIYPFEVEEALCSHPEVMEASVFGVPDPKWVERLVAVVTLAPGSAISTQSIIEYVRAHLPGYKTPKAVYVVDSLPKSPVGKVLRKALREQFSNT